MNKKQYYQEIAKRKAKSFLWFFVKYIPDELFIKIVYFMKFKKWIDLDNPKTFNEKVQYLKLKQTDQIYSDLADKFKVREYIKEKLWEEVLTKFYWYWKDPMQIPFDTLPKKFVIKCNHWSGYNIIVPDKNKLDIKQTIHIVNLRMKEDYRIFNRELQYKNIDKMIIIEEFLEDEEFKYPIEYKSFCFWWKSLFILLDYNKKRAIFDREWKKMDFDIKFSNYNWEEEKFYSIDKIVNYSEILSKWFVYTRVDFYISNKKILFWEITFFSWSWHSIFLPNHDELDKKYWNMILLDK